MSRDRQGAFVRRCQFPLADNRVSKSCRSGNSATHDRFTLVELNCKRPASGRLVSPCSRNALHAGVCRHSHARLGYKDILRKRHLTHFLWHRPSALRSRYRKKRRSGTPHLHGCVWIRFCGNFDGIVDQGALRVQFTFASRLRLENLEITLEQGESDNEADAN